MSSDTQENTAVGEVGAVEEPKATNEQGAIGNSPKGKPEPPTSTTTEPPPPNSPETATTPTTTTATTATAPKLSARQQRLLALKERMAKAKVENRRASKQERAAIRTARQDGGDTPAARRRKKRGRSTDPEQAAKESEAELLKSKGYDLTRRELFETADEAEAKQGRKMRKKGKHGSERFGWNVYGNEASSKSYHRRVDSSVAYEESGEYRGESADLVLHKPTEAAIEHMRGELEKQKGVRNKISRRRAYKPDKDIDYINSRNKYFNAKAERAFGKYAAEVKANLERGTAL